jgi:hypothetical protein
LHSPGSPHLVEFSCQLRMTMEVGVTTGVAGRQRTWQGGDDRTEGDNDRIESDDRKWEDDDDGNEVDDGRKWEGDKKKQIVSLCPIIKYSLYTVDLTGTCPTP